jgi:acetyl-CoA acetyltransferase
MTGPVVIAGTGTRIGTAVRGSIEDAVRDCVHAALSAAGMASLDAIDMVVTVGSDILDGSMVATRSGIAGAYGHELMTVPSSAGHALAAAVALIESGQARHVLLVGWGEGTKFAVRDGRVIQADPFYARPVGARPAVLAALQAQRLIGSGVIDLHAAGRYCTAMRARAGVALPSGATDWLTPRWCDGAAAVVLAAGMGGIEVCDFGTAFRPYCPEPDDLDPAGWVREAAARLSAPDVLDRALAVIEGGGPTPICEGAALRALRIRQGWAIEDARLNPSGGSAAAHFGPATGLARLAAAAAALRDGGQGIVVDLAGPIGQATTVILLGAETRQ